MLGLLDGRIYQRLIGNHAPRLDAAGCSQYGFWLGVINPHGQFICSKTAKDHRMNGANTRASQHCHNRFGHHRHVNNHPVALGDALGAQRTGEAGSFIAQIGIADGVFLSGDGAVIDNRGLRAFACNHMAVDCIIAGVDHRIRIPFIKRCLAGIQCVTGRAVPINMIGSFHPKRLGVGFPTLIKLAISHLAISQSDA